MKMWGRLGVIVPGLFVCVGLRVRPGIGVEWCRWYEESLAALRMTAKTAKTDSGRVKDEIQGSLHCAADDEAVRCFGRDDVLIFWGDDVLGCGSRR
jgi:hypothetical protein